MMPHKKCCVVGCEDKVSSRHRFPNPKKFMDRYKIWIQKTGNDVLQNLDAQRVYENYRICHNHFTAEDISSNMFLKENAIPSRFLPDVSVAEVSKTNFETGIPLTDITNIPLSEDIRNIPSTSEIPLTDITNILLTEDIQNIPLTEDIRDIPSTSDIPVTDITNIRFTEDIQNIPTTSKGICVVHGIRESEHDFEDITSTPKRRKLSSKFRQGFTVQRSILQSVGVTRVNELSPKAQVLYKKTRAANKSLNVLRKRSQLFKRRSMLSKEYVLQKATSTLNSHVAKFVESQVKLSTVSPQGRRFTLEDKVLALILHKQSGKGYKMLSRLFCLPTRKTMMTLLNRIPITTGINETLFDNLKANVYSLQENDRACIVMFDEMQIQPQIIFNKHKKEFEGCEDMGDKRTPEIADHALVFMVKGITKNWKQPLTYSFCQGTVKTSDLARHIKLIISECQRAGLKVMATVCDQGATNIAAINYLVQTIGIKKEVKDLKMFLVNEQPIIHIFDSPHLLKGVRNNFLKKNLLWRNDEKTLCAKWEHVIKVFEEDNSPGELRTLPKITEAHVFETKMKKMKVSQAAQILSHTLAAQMSLLTRAGIIKDQGAADTSKVLAFFDELFDSVNGHTLWPLHGKKMKCAASTESGHLPYWFEARKHLSNMCFVNKKLETVRPPSLKNWICTLNGMEELLKLLVHNGIRFFFPRQINQDPLENFFGQMRQHGGRNTNPDVVVFKNHFRTLLINNLVNKHSVNSNCQADDSTFIINCIKNFVTQGLPEEDYELIHMENEEILTILRNCNVQDNHFSYITKISIGYVSGFISKNLKTVRSCSTCKKNIICEDKIAEWHDFVDAKEYISDCSNKLKRCTPHFLNGLSKLYNFILLVLQHIYFKKRCVAVLIEYLNDNFCFNFKYNCEHKTLLQKTIIEKFCILICHNWASGINKILQRKDCRIVYGDEMYCRAKNYIIKKKHNK